MNNNQSPGTTSSYPDDLSIPSTPEQTVRTLNGMVRGEIAAGEAYRLAIEKLSDGRMAEGPAVLLLRGIYAEHERAAQTLRARIEELGGEPVDSSGVRGAVDNAIQGAMDFFGDALALRNLKAGEEKGLAAFEEGLRNVDAATGKLLCNQMVPAQQRHIVLLTQLIADTFHS